MKSISEASSSLSSASLPISVEACSEFAATLAWEKRWGWSEALEMRPDEDEMGGRDGTGEADARPLLLGSGGGERGRGLSKSMSSPSCSDSLGTSGGDGGIGSRSSGCRGESGESGDNGENGTETPV